MTLLLALARFIVVFSVFAIAMAFGAAILRLFRLRVEHSFERGLFACGIGFFALELATFALNIPGWLNKTTAWCLVIVAAAIAWRGWGSVREFAAGLGSRLMAHWRDRHAATRLILVCIAAVCVLEALLASAPLTGSDAMHYHFTVPLLQSASPLRPRFDITNSFLTGQAHLLISLGLALGSDRFALGLIFLGGLLTVATLYLIARQLMSSTWSLLAVLTLLISPMVFWQTGTSGSPDIWMGFYAGIAVLAARRALENNDSSFVILAGLFAGNAAGVKYTGWTVPIAICGYLLLFFRPRISAIWSCCVAFLGGCLPLLRNAVWTKDPLFPFLMRWLNPSHVNTYAMRMLHDDTRSVRFSLAPFHLLAFPFSLTIHGDRFGLGQYFGPIILAFAPLLLFVPWKSHLTRLCFAVWGVAFVVDAVTSQMGRFLLPVYSIALALVFAGVVAGIQRKWRFIPGACVATVVLFIAFAGASDLLYAKDFLPVVVGTESTEAFLSRMAPDFQTAAFVNQSVSATQREQGGKVLVFFRHLYYLRIPYINGDPDTSWLLDPAHYADSANLLRELKDEDVRWVVNTGDYPEPFADAFHGLERDGKLTPIATTKVESLAGESRIYRQRQSLTVNILRVN
ncbi:MAG TPA: glycosyltransferase family 39 protein [Candidatus Acidoferrales bacterium]